MPQPKIPVGNNQYGDPMYMSNGPFLRLLNELYESWEDLQRVRLEEKAKVEEALAQSYDRLRRLKRSRERAERNLAQNFDKLRKQLGRL